jgi:hypothetical protein
MSTELWDVEVEAGLGKQRGDFSTQSASRNIWFVDRISQNIPHLFFHAPAVLSGAVLQTRLNPIFDFANNKLRHGVLPMKMIS